VDHGNVGAIFRCAALFLPCPEGLDEVLSGWGAEAGHVVVALEGDLPGIAFGPAGALDVEDVQSGGEAAGRVTLTEAGAGCGARASDHEARHEGRVMYISWTCFGIY
jgi:hypothetical protein